MAEEKVGLIQDEKEAVSEETDQMEKTVSHKKIEGDTPADEKGTEEEIVVKQESETEKLKRELSESQDKYLRLYSDFENFRRRTAKEKLELIEFASESLIIDLLPVVDDFERAIQSMNEAKEVKSVCDGVNLIFNKMKKVLTDKGLSEIECIEKDFDPEIHEALTKIPAPKKKLKGKVVDQIQKGYSLKGKVIRHSKVVVGE